MFDLFFHGMMAFQQAAMILGGGICFAIGAFIMGNGLYWRIRAERVDATIIGVRKKGIYYYPVYRYTLASGEQRETTSSTGTNSMRGMETGKALRLMVFPDKPEEARPAASFLYLIISVFFLGPGILFLKIALFSYPLTGMTYAMFGVLGLMAAFKISKHIIPKEQRGTLEEWRAKRKAEHTKEWENSPLSTMEDFAASPEGKQASALERKQARVGMPVLIVLGVAMVYGAWHVGEKTIELTKHGIHTRGKIVEMQLSYDNDGDSSYHAIVEFKGQEGVMRRFRDNFGSSWPNHDVGDDVPVLYLLNRPYDSGIIDHGLMNWLIPGLLGGFGVVLVLLGFSMLRYRDSAA